MSEAGVRVRDAVDADLGAITAIYAEGVLTGTGTFELTAPEAAETAPSKPIRQDKREIVGAPFDGMRAGCRPFAFVSASPAE